MSVMVYLVIGVVLGLATYRWREKLGGGGRSLLVDGPQTALEWVVIVTAIWPLLLVAGLIALVSRR